MVWIVFIVVGVMALLWIGKHTYMSKFEEACEQLSVPMRNLDEGMKERYTPHEAAFMHAVGVHVKAWIADPTQWRATHNALCTALEWVEKGSVRKHIFAVTCQSAENELQAHGLTMEIKGLH